MNRWRFCFSPLALPRLTSLAESALPPGKVLLTPDSSGRLCFLLEDPFDHPFYLWLRRTEIELHGPPKKKLHVRAVACHAGDEGGEPCDKYLLNMKKLPPRPPGGLRAEPAEGAATVNCGEVLGVMEYRLYAGTPGQHDFRVVYSRLKCSYIDCCAEISACAAQPQDSARAGTASWRIASARVTVGRGRTQPPGEHESCILRNWDPKPGERFRRVYSFDPETSLRRANYRVITRNDSAWRPLARLS